MSDESIQSGVIETQEMQAIQVLFDYYLQSYFQEAKKSVFIAYLEHQFSSGFETKVVG